jgi:amino acid permease
VICDSWTQILAGFGFTVGREQVLLGVTMFVLLPLCLMENLSVLSYTSLLGSGGMVFTLYVMVQRFIDKSYLPGGTYYDSVAAQFHPSFEGAPGIFAVEKFQTLTLVSLLSTAFIAHYNAPKFYQQVANRTPARVSKISCASFIIAITLFLAFMVVGYMTFGTNSQGFILNNYSPIDPLASAARAAISTSMILTYPLAFTGLRDGTAGLLGGNVNRTMLTVGLLSFITGVACFVTDVGFLNAIQGAILGSALIYCFPGMILLYHAENSQGKPGLGRSTVLVARFTVVLGIVLGACGAAIILFPKQL